MANIHRGEVALEIEGTVYTLHAGINAIADAESVFSTPDRRVPYHEIIGHAMQGSATHVRALIWAMLRRHHKDMSLTDVGDLIDRVGLQAIDQKFAELLTQTAPDPADLKKLGVGESRPQKARAAKTGGTSGRSALKPVA